MKFTALFFLSCLTALSLPAQDPAVQPSPAESTASPTAAEPTPPVSPQSPSPSTVPASAPATDSTPTLDEPVPSAEAAAPSPAENANDPAPSDEFSQKTLPPPRTPTPRVIPSSHGQREGEVWIGHRAVIERYAGWGWIKREREPWSRARWVMLEEEPGQRMAPGRFHSRPTLDDNTQYRIFGQFADYKGYEPNLDVFVDVFRITGWETIGPATRPDLKPPRGSTGGAPRWSERGANMPRR